MSNKSELEFQVHVLEQGLQKALQHLLNGSPARARYVIEAALRGELTTIDKTLAISSKLEVVK